MIKQRRKSNNLIEFYHYGAVFINARTTKATYRWLEYNEVEKRGIGYDEYESGSIRAVKIDELTLEVTANAIKFIDRREASSKIQNIKY